MPQFIGMRPTYTNLWPLWIIFSAKLIRHNHRCLLNICLGAKETQGYFPLSCWFQYNHHHMQVICMQHACIIIRVIFVQIKTHAYCEHFNKSDVPYWLVYTSSLWLDMMQYIPWNMHTVRALLTLDVWGPSYLGLTRSISWLMMPWLLTSPGHQQPWHWLCRIGRFLSYLMKNLNYLCRINVEKWHKMYIYVYVPSEKIST